MYVLIFIYNEVNWLFCNNIILNIDIKIYRTENATCLNNKNTIMLFYMLNVDVHINFDK